MAPPGSYPTAGHGPIGESAGGTEAGSPSSARRSILGGITGLIGGGLTVTGVFSGWVTLGDTGTVSGWSLTGGEGLLASDDPYILVGLSVLAVVGGLMLLGGAARTLVRVAMALVGISIVTVTSLNWLSIADFVETNLPSSFEATAAVGFYLTLAGGIITALASLMPAAKTPGATS
jgi:hypothetical protein